MASTPKRKKVDPLNELRQRKYEAGHGDADAFNRQHAKGKLTARERINRLVDRNSFEEIDIFATHRATGFGLPGHRLGSVRAASAHHQPGQHQDPDRRTSQGAPDLS